MNFSQAHLRLVQVGALLAAVATVAGCGNQFRPVILPQNPNGPPAQPVSYAVVISAPAPVATSPGIATIIDYSGDTIMAQASVGVGPVEFTESQSGTFGYTLNSDHTITYFPVTKTLQQYQVNYITLPTTAEPVNLFTPGAGMWAADLCATAVVNGPCENAADVFLSFPGSLTYAIPVTEPPAVMVAGYNIGSTRNYVLSQNISSSTGVECNVPPFSAVTLNGQATGIETGSYTTDLPIPAGKCPVYAVTSSDGNRFFVLNRASDSITVIDLQTNTLDYPCPATNQDGQPIHCPLNGVINLPVGSGPIYAEYNIATSQLVVSNYDGGTVSIIDVSMDAYGNDSSTFGTTYTVPVGNNPASVTVLYDGSRAYTANQTDQTVTVVNLSSHTVEKTLPVTGHPRTVVSTENSNYGKVYVASPDTNVLTVIATGGNDPDTIDTTIPLQGDVVDVRVTSQNGVTGGGNTNNLSRIPGYGQPCDLPPALMTSTYGANYTLAQCQTLP